MEGFHERAAELGLILYVPDFHNDLTLFNWYKFLINNDEFEHLFTEKQRSLSKFFKAFELPCILVFGLDEEGAVWHAIWFMGNDYGNSASVSGWTREDMRGSQKQYDVTRFIYSMAFGVWSVLTSTTKHERLLRNLRRMGYNIVGSIPDLVMDEEGWILYLTKENFEKSERYLGEK
jgi:hypothetical protein